MSLDFLSRFFRRINLFCLSLYSNCRFDSSSHNYELLPLSTSTSTSTGVETPNTVLKRNKNRNKLILQLLFTALGAYFYYSQLLGGAFPQDSVFIRNHLTYLISCLVLTNVSFSIVFVAILYSQISWVSALVRVAAVFAVILCLFAYDQGADCQFHGQFSMIITLLTFPPFFFVIYFLNSLLFYFKKHRKFIITVFCLLIASISGFLISSSYYQNKYSYGLFNQKPVDFLENFALRPLRSGTPYYDILPLYLFVKAIDNAYVPSTFRASIVSRKLYVTECKSEIFYIPLFDTKSWTTMQKLSLASEVQKKLVKIKYIEPVVLPEDCESVIVECGTQKLIEIDIVPKSAKINRDSDKKPFNTLIIFLDAVSRRQFLRKLPLTAAVLESLHTPPRKRVNQFFRYGVTGFNTDPNTQALYAGHQVKEYEPNTYDRFYSSLYPPVWRSFYEKGYVTSWMTNDCDDYSSHYFRGSTSSFLTHEFIAPFCHPDYYSLEDPWGNFKGVYSLKSRFLFGSYVHNMGLRWIDSMRATYRNKSVPWFMVNAFVEGHEGTAEILNTMDKDLADFLHRMDIDGELDNTALFLLSDHGNHMSPYFLLTENGKIEHASPFLFTVLPESVTSKPGIVDALNWNENVYIYFLFIFIL